MESSCTMSTAAITALYPITKPLVEPDAPHARTHADAAPHQQDSPAGKPVSTRHRTDAVAAQLGRFHPAVQATALAFLAALTGGGGFAVLGGGDGSDELSDRIAALEVRVDERDRDFKAALEANQSAMKSVQDVSMLALELSVDGHRYLTDTMVEAARLDHPDFTPQKRSARLEGRLDRGTRLLDDSLYAR